ncbi:hypothetical protein [Flexithrix dorotheae]|uniref:hypothetical protein n=1 Tax=Flexithrix dorotheae TaxID=70993 RepID=UPI000382D18A|nr:hypothetical protein [Flexithrix dorotheae]
MKISAKIQKLLAIDYIEPAIDELEIYLKDNDISHYNQVLKVSGEYYHLEGENRSGEISKHDYRKLVKKVRNKILKIANELDLGNRATI